MHPGFRELAIVDQVDALSIVVQTLQWQCSDAESLPRDTATLPNIHVMISSRGSKKLRRIVSNGLGHPAWTGGLGSRERGWSRFQRQQDVQARTHCENIESTVAQVRGRRARSVGVTSSDLLTVS